MFGGCKVFFSVIVPVYNVEQYLDVCIKSLINQTFNDFEIILVDDGSTDSSGLKCDIYSKDDSRIKVIHKKNEGLLLARRTGLKASSGKYIIHCDSDDYLDIKTLSVLYSFLRNEEYDMVMYGYNVVDDCGNILENHYKVFEDGTIITQKEKEKIIFQLVSTSWLNNMWTKVCRREIIDINEDYREYQGIQMGEDLFQVVPLIDSSNSFYYLAKPLYSYRFNPKGISKKYKISYLYNFLDVSERLFQLCNNNNVSDNTYRAFFDRFEHDVYKYLLRFLKNGINQNEYFDLYNIIKKNELFLKSNSFRQKMRKSNSILRELVKPQYYYLTRIISKSVLSHVLL